MNVGDQVQYVPAQEHALEVDEQGCYQWVFGFRDRKGQVEELTIPRLREVLSNLAKHPNRGEVSKNLVLLRPAKTWAATVRAVNPDKTVGIDVRGTKPWITLHYDNVPVCSRDNPKPHSCYS